MAAPADYGSGMDDRAGNYLPGDRTAAAAAGEVRCRTDSAASPSGGWKLTDEFVIRVVRGRVLSECRWLSTISQDTNFYVSLVRRSCINN